MASAGVHMAGAVHPPLALEAECCLRPSDWGRATLQSHRGVMMRCHPCAVRCCCVVASCSTTAKFTLKRLRCIRRWE